MNEPINESATADTMAATANEKLNNKNKVNNLSLILQSYELNQNLHKIDITLRLAGFNKSGLLDSPATFLTEFTTFLIKNGYLAKS